MQHVNVLLLLLVSPWHAESFLPRTWPRHLVSRTVEHEQHKTRMCVFSAEKAATAAGVASDGDAAGGGWRASTWSNPGGKDLIQVSDGVWAIERPFVWNSIDVGESADQLRVY